MMACTVLVTLDKQRRLTEARRRRDDLIWALQRKWKWSQKCASDRYGVVTNIINNMSWERLQEGRGALLEIQKTFKGRYHLNNRGGGWHHILWYNYRETKKKPSEFREWQTKGEFRWSTKECQKGSQARDAHMEGRGGSEKLHIWKGKLWLWTSVWLVKQHWNC